MSSTIVVSDYQFGFETELITKLAEEAQVLPSIGWIVTFFLKSFQTHYVGSKISHVLLYIQKVRLLCFFFRN